MYDTWDVRVDIEKIRCAFYMRTGVKIYSCNLESSILLVPVSGPFNIPGEDGLRSRV